MNKNFATIHVGNTIDNILEKGANKLYDRYLQHKLPQHTHGLNDVQIQNNLKMETIKHSLKAEIETVTNKIAQHIPADAYASKRITVKRHSKQ